jgi:hypothetical protein
MPSANSLVQMESLIKHQKLLPNRYQKVLDLT